jgi:hypothetical protein
MVWTQAPEPDIREQTLSSHTEPALRNLKVGVPDRQLLENPPMDNSRLNGKGYGHG